MTSPSPTRPRTIRPPSIREPGHTVVEPTLLAVIVCLLAAPVPAGWRELQRSEPPSLAVPVVVVEVDGDAGEKPGDEGPAALEAEAVASTVDGVVATVGEVEPARAEDDADGSAAADDKEEDDACRRALEKLRSDSLADIDLDIRVGGRPGSDYPQECRLEGETYQPRRFATTTFTWKAAGYCHKPLYFEHWNLERYGHSHGFVADSFLSAAHFFGRLPTLPYQMGVELPWECVYPLGYYRPGSCAPWTVPAVPVSVRGLAVGAATATGIVFLLP